MKLTRSEQMLCNLIIKLWKEKQQLNKQINQNKNIEIKLKINNIIIFID